MSEMRENGYEERPAEAIGRLMLPERAHIVSPSVREADIEISSHLRADTMDTTHFDTIRFPPPDWALETFAKVARDGSLAYTGYRGNAEVLATVAGNVSRFLGVNVDPKQNLMLTPGTQGGLFAVLAARINPGDRVAVFSPDYLFSARILRFFNADIGYVPLIEDGERLTVDLDALEVEFATRNTKHLVFSHPNNPTGAVFSKATVSRIAELARKFGVSVVADELYSRLVYDDAPFHHMAAEEGMFEQTATLLGPSKTESFSGYRLGVLVGSPTLIKAVENVQSIASLRAPAYAQHLLSPWLDEDKDWLKTRLTELQAIRDMTVDRLGKLTWMGLKPQGGTAYLWPDVSALGVSDKELALAFLKEANVLISPGYQFGPITGRFRICYARDEALWSEALDAMIAIMERYARKAGI